MEKYGIYCIENLINGKKYIGSSIDVYKRRNRHFSELKRKTHKNVKLQSSYNKYGFDNFKFYVIEFIFNKEDLILKEQYYIDTIKPEYNINLIANSSLGVKRSEETKEKIIQANLGLKHSDERNKIKSKAQGGENHWTKKKLFSNESKLKMSLSQKELYKNGYKSPKSGVPLNKNIKEKISKSCSKIVLQYDLNMILIKEWKNAKEAYEVSNYGVKYISQCCNNKRKKYKNYIWKFKEKL